MKVFVTRDRVPEAIALLRERFEVDVWEEDSPPPPQVLVRKAAECDALLTEIDNIVDREVLASPRLRVVANRAVGMDNVDIPEATRRGILLSNTPGVLTNSCADFTFALILAAARNVVMADRRYARARGRCSTRGRTSAPTSTERRWASSVSEPSAARSRAGRGDST